jgi:hypothetical protein
MKAKRNEAYADALREKMKREHNSALAFGTDA